MVTDQVEVVLDDRVDFVFADDSRQESPSRLGMGPLVAFGGIHVPANSVRGLERSIDNLCVTSGFPNREPFKWSPSKNLWMAKNLVQFNRLKFFERLLNLAKNYGVQACVVVCDTQYMNATAATSHETDVVWLFLERVHRGFLTAKCTGVVIVDTPSGDRQAEGKFLGDCVEMLSSGTDYCQPNKIALSVLTGKSNHVRLLQLADVITSCTTQYVAGETQYSPPVFELIRPLLRSDNDRIGGVGLKIHPDLKYANLYHWLLGDEVFWKGISGYSLPLSNLCYSSDDGLSIHL